MYQTYEELKKYLDKAVAIKAALTLFEWDNETLAPEQASSYTSQIIGSLSEQYREILIDPKVEALIDSCRCEELDELQAGILREAKEEIEILKSIPAAEYRAFTELVTTSTHIWAKARRENDFEIFAPVLEQIVDYQKKFASYRAKKGQKLYDVMLDMNEKDFDMEILDRFFTELKENLVPMLATAKAASKQIKTDFLSADYPMEAQEKAARLIAEYVGYDFTKGVLAVSNHPFTTNLHNRDIRITTHYGKSIDSSLFSVIHEAGHGIYEMGIDDKLTLTLAGQGASMGMHESQSRFYENVIGRNKAFWEPVYTKVADLFGDPLKSIKLDDFIKTVNKVESGLIRIDADELSYSLHVLVRYEIEKMMIEENVPVRELPEIWNKKYEEYLGVRPSHDGEGILQDIHWSQGSFGYFPSYALGSAFAAQIYAHMRKVMDFDEVLRSGDISPITEYLRLHIHQYGKTKSSRQMIFDMTGEDFSPNYYIEYLKAKYEC